jgi:hypothetical protein
LDRRASSKVESAVPEAQKISAQQLKALDALATERILDAGGSALDVKRKILSGGAEKVR